jgi:predicted nucleic acid-binding protein
MIVVSDASPITTLLKADQATLLKRLFDFVVIPEAVSEEFAGLFMLNSPASFTSSRSPLAILRYEGSPITGLGLSLN